MENRDNEQENIKSILGKSETQKCENNKSNSIANIIIIIGVIIVASIYILVDREIINRNIFDKLLLGVIVIGGINYLLCKSY